MGGAMQADKSKNMNSSALPWGVKAFVLQPVGKGFEGSELSPPATVVSGMVTLTLR